MEQEKVPNLQKEGGKIQGKTEVNSEQGTK